MRFFCCFFSSTNTVSEKQPLSPRCPDKTAVEEAKKYLEAMQTQDQTEYNKITIGSNSYKEMKISDFLTAWPRIAPKNDEDIINFANSVLAQNSNTQALYNSCKQTTSSRPR